MDKLSGTLLDGSSPKTQGNINHPKPFITTSIEKAQKIMLHGSSNQRYVRKSRLKGH